MVTCFGPQNQKLTKVFNSKLSKSTKFSIQKFLLIFCVRKLRLCANIAILFPFLSNKSMIKTVFQVTLMTKWIKMEGEIEKNF